MSRIAEAFQKGKAFIPFITCGDPDLETTGAIVRALEKNGADLIELGIPFSDPTAEGPVIQGANIRALAGGVTTDRIFDFVRELRRDVKVPMVFMTYANVVFSYGTERFVQTCAQIGMDGLILPDVPFEEKEEFDSVCRKYGQRQQAQEHRQRQKEAANSFTHRLFPFWFFLSDRQAAACTASLLSFFYDSLQITG